MKSRLAVTLLVVLGLFMSVSGVALGGTALSQSAASTQYVAPVALTQQTPPSAPAQAPAAAPAPVQAPQQVAAQAPTGQLPFTGYAAISALLAGLGLLGTGLVLRRRSARSDSSD
jgi:hypothetical protein